MAEILAPKTSLPGCEAPGTPEAVWAGALFVSALQPSGSPSPGQVSRAVATTLRIREATHSWNDKAADRFRRRRRAV